MATPRAGAHRVQRRGEVARLQRSVSDPRLDRSPDRPDAMEPLAEPARPSWSATTSQLPTSSADRSELDDRQQGPERSRIQIGRSTAMDRTSRTRRTCSPSGTLISCVCLPEIEHIVDSAELRAVTVGREVGGFDLHVRDRGRYPCNPLQLAADERGAADVSPVPPRAAKVTVLEHGTGRGRLDAVLDQPQICIAKRAALEARRRTTCCRTSRDRSGCSRRWRLATRCDRGWRRRTRTCRSSCP